MSLFLRNLDLLLLQRINNNWKLAGCHSRHFTSRFLVSSLSTKKLHRETCGTPIIPSKILMLINLKGLFFSLFVSSLRRITQLGRPQLCLSLLIYMPTGGGQSLRQVFLRKSLSSAVEEILSISVHLGFLQRTKKKTLE